MLPAQILHGHAREDVARMTGWNRGEVEVHRRADRLRAPAGRGRLPTGRRLSAARRQRSHVLHLEKNCAHLGVAELRQLRSLEDENARLKRLVADLTLDKHMLAEALRKKV